MSDTFSAFVSVLRVARSGDLVHFFAMALVSDMVTSGAGAMGVRPHVAAHHTPERNMPATAPPPPILVSLREAARLLAVSDRHLWQLQRDGVLPVVRVGRALRFRIADLERWAAQAAGRN